MKGSRRLKLCMVMGTRPEIIKMASLVRCCARTGLDYFVINTGQHYDRLMSGVFYRELGLPRPRYSLAGKSGTHAEETARMMVFIERVLLKERPGVVMVEGDTNSVLAGALTACKLRIPVAHVEAGLRSFDRRMPEEINRVLTDHIADYCFAPTKISEKNLLREGVRRGKIFVVGNTVVDAVRCYARSARRPRALERRLGFPLRKGGYFLVTAHRPENVDDPAILRDIVKGLGRVHERYGLPVIYPVHPRSKKMLKRAGISSILARILAKRGIHMVDPVRYFHQLWLLENARLVITDSGGIQEECCILKVPCVTIRLNTERPETVSVGSNVIAGTDPSKIVSCVGMMLKRKRAWANPFGDGASGRRIITAILRAQPARRRNR